MWELFERRLEAEHYLGPSVRAKRVVDRLIEVPGEVSDEALRAGLESLSYVELRAFYARTVELTGGPTGQDEIQDAGPWLPHRARLVALRAISSAVVRDATNVRQ